MANLDYREEVIPRSPVYPTLLQAWNHPLRPSSRCTSIYVVVREIGSQSSTETETDMAAYTVARTPLAHTLRPWSAPHPSVEDMHELRPEEVLFARQQREDGPEDDMLGLHT